MAGRRRGSALAKVEIDFLILSDSAQVVGQKLYVLGGGWNRILAGGYPANHPMAICVGVLVPWTLTDEAHTVTVQIVDQDGNPVTPPLKAELKVGRPVDLEPGTPQRLIFAIQGIIGIPRQGSYVVQATVGEVSRSAGFHALIKPGMPVAGNQ